MVETSPGAQPAAAEVFWAWAVEPTALDRMKRVGSSGVGSGGSYADVAITDGTGEQQAARHVGHLLWRHTSMSSRTTQQEDHLMSL